MSTGTLDVLLDQPTVRWQVPIEGKRRYFVELDAFCSPQDGPDGMCWPAKTRNLSHGGIGLIMNRAFDPKSEVTVKLLGHNHAWIQIECRVIHSTPRADGDWLVGCEFKRLLSHSQLYELIG